MISSVTVSTNQLSAETIDLLIPQIITGLEKLLAGTRQGEVVVYLREELLTLETKEREGEIRVRNIPDPLASPESEVYDLS